MGNKQASMDQSGVLLAIFTIISGRGEMSSEFQVTDIVTFVAPFVAMAGLLVVFKHFF